MNIKVSIHRLKSRRFYRAQWIDPVTGAKRFKSTGTSIRREAERFAARLEDELKDASGKPTDSPWSVFRQRYEIEHLAYKSERTRTKTSTAFDHVERFVNPATVGAFQTPQIITLTNALGGQGNAPPTIASYLRHIRAGLHWARKVGILSAVPKFVFPDEDKRPGGRPVSREEFERILAVCQK